MRRASFASRTSRRRPRSARTPVPSRTTPTTRKRAAPERIGAKTANAWTVTKTTSAAVASQVSRPVSRIPPSTAYPLATSEVGRRRRARHAATRRAAGPRCRVSRLVEAPQRQADGERPGPGRRARPRAGRRGRRAEGDGGEEQRRPETDPEGDAGVGLAPRVGQRRDEQADEHEHRADLAPRGGEVAPPEHRCARRRRATAASPAAAIAVDTAKAPSPALGHLPDEPEGEQHDAEHERARRRARHTPRAAHPGPRRRRAAARRPAPAGSGRPGRRRPRRPRPRAAAPHRRPGRRWSPSRSRRAASTSAAATRPSQIATMKQERVSGDICVEVRGDEPDQAEADEAGAEGEDDAREGEAAARDVPRADGLRGARGRRRPSACQRAAARPRASAAGRGWRRARPGRGGRERRGWRLGGAVIAGSSVSGGHPGGCTAMVLPGRQPRP